MARKTETWTAAHVECTPLIPGLTGEQIDLARYGVLEDRKATGQRKCRVCGALTDREVRVR